MEQDSYEDVANCVEMVLSTPKGLRSALSSFGIDDPTFTQVDPNVLRADLQDWEPRAMVEIDIFNDDSGSTGDSAGAVNANVNISITDINYTA
jgi:phage baseplate assembly protein W